MKVLVAYEFSGTVRDAFLRRGHEAISCDLLPSESNYGPHIQGDIRDVETSSCDLLIAHPPCTALASSGARWFKDKVVEQAEAIAFCTWLLEAPVAHIAMENPIGVLSTQIRKPDQIIQPWQFGHEETKSTCLWLKNLPLLSPTKVMEVRNKNLTPSGQNKLGPSPDRWKLRSKTYTGIAEAMAEQWQF